jgi:SAM-dependent methyltransferase
VIQREKVFFYDRIADSFDAIMNRYDLGRRLELVFDRFLPVDELTGRSLLDVGAGTGWFSQRAVAAGARVVALDVGLRLLTKVREKCNARLVAADACRLPFADRSFEIVLSSECIEHTPDPLGAVREMIRVLRPGGVLVVTVPNRLWRLSAVAAAVLKLRPYEGLENWVSWPALRRTLRAGGLTITTMVGFHLFPPVVRVTWPLLRAADGLGGVAGPLMLNIGVKARK